jgi:penicillin-insensitive murein endopeptidase
MIARLSSCRMTRALVHFVAAWALANTAQAASVCYGRVAQGRVEDSVRLPASGPNFSVYSRVAAAAGRTHVHSDVAAIMVAAYAATARVLPDATFVYGETGWPSGGRLRPHRTHQNGLSVDFFVPVRDAAGRSVPLPTPATQRFGYDLDFNADARLDGLHIDFAALAEHLHQLDVAAKARGRGLALVIFDTAYLPRLFATPRGAYLRAHVRFMKGQPWVRHDEHYHVDFAIPCQP